MTGRAKKLLVSALVTLALRPAFGSPPPAPDPGRDVPPGRAVRSPGKLAHLAAVGATFLFPFGPVESDEPGRTDYRGRWAIVIGINNYSPKRPDLRRLGYAVNDASAVRDALRDDFGFDHIQYLGDGEASLAAIRAAFARWSVGAEGKDPRPGPDDALVVFYAGHGLLGDRERDGMLGGEWYMSAANSTGEDPYPFLAETWVRRQMAQVAARHKLLILDSCYAGELFREPLRPNDPSTPRSQPRVIPSGAVANVAVAAAAATRANLAASRGDRGLMGAGHRDLLPDFLAERTFVAITAGRTEPTSDGDAEDEHSIFTRSLLQVLARRADSPRVDQAFTFRELAVQVEVGVREYLKSAQVPDWGRLAPGQGEFVFRPRSWKLTPSGESRRRNYVVTMSGARVAWERGDVAHAVDLLETLRPNPGEEDLRGFEWYYLWRLTHTERLTLLGHTSNVLDARVSPDGRRVVSIDARNVIKRWDAATGRILATIPPRLFTQWMSQYASIDREARLTTRSVPEGLSVLDVATGETLSTLKVGPNFQLAYSSFSPDGKRVAWVGRTVKENSLYDSLAGLWDWQAVPSRSTPVPQRKPIVAIAFTDKGRTLVVGGSETPAFGDKDDRSVVLRTADGKEDLSIREGLLTPPSALAATDDGKAIVAGAQGGRLRLWDAKNPAGRWLFSGPQLTATQLPFFVPPAVGAVEFSPDGRTIASGLMGPFMTTGPAPLGAIALWDLEKGQRVAVFVCDSGGTTSVHFSADGSSLVTGGYNGSVHVWDLSQRQEPTTFRAYEGRPWHPPPGVIAVNGRGEPVPFTTNVSTPNPAAGLTAPPVGKVFVSRGYDNEVRLWDYSAGVPSVPVLSGYTDLWSSCFSEDGQRFAFALRDGRETPMTQGKVQVWDVALRKPMRPFLAHGSRLTCLDFSPDGSFLATGCVSGEFKLWRTDDWQPAGTMTLSPRAEATSLAFSRDGTALAVAGLGADLAATVEVWDVTNRTRRARLSAPPIPVLSELEQFKRENQAQDLPHPAPIQGLDPGRSLLPMVAFSRDGTTLTLFDRDRSLTFWDTSGWTRRAKLTGLFARPMQAAVSGTPAPLGRLSFAPSGRTLTVSSASLVSVLDPAWGTEIASVDGLPPSLAAPAWDYSPPQFERSIATRAGEGIALRDPVTLQERWNLYSGPFGNDNWPIAFSADGKTLISGDSDNTLFLWFATSDNEPPSLISRLYHELTDGDPQVRRNAAEAALSLGRRSHPIVEDLIRLSRQDPDAEVRATAAIVLDRLGHPNHPLNYEERRSRRFALTGSTSAGSGSSGGR